MSTHPTIIHPQLAFTRCIEEGGQIVTEHVPEGSCCEACGKADTDTGWPGKRWLVRGYRKDAPWAVVRIPGKHLVCHDCLIMWNE